MSKVKVLILEDLPFQRLMLSSALQMRGYDISDSVGTIEEALTSFKENPPDLALLDIGIGKELNGGIQVGKAIRQSSNIPIIYLTGRSNITQNLQAVGPEVLLTKPYSDTDLFNNLDIAMQKHYGSNKKWPNVYFQKDFILIRESVGSIRQKIFRTHILYLESKKNNVKVYTNIKTEKSKELKYFTVPSIQLYQFLEDLPQRNFCRTHRGYGVNLEHVKEYNANSILLDEGDIRIPLSRKYKDIFRNKFDSFFSNYNYNL